MPRKRRILFAKLGRFSYTDDEVINQLLRNFPGHDLVVADVKDLAKQSYFSSFFNLLTEFALFGPSVFPTAVSCMPSSSARRSCSAA
jgi:hypothetical protein